jgi:hypothetical protein
VLHNFYCRFTITAKNNMAALKFNLVCQVYNSRFLYAQNKPNGIVIFATQICITYAPLPPM